jgi:two-component system, NtrC family, response regulator GlrR
MAHSTEVLADRAAGPAIDRIELAVIGGPDAGASARSTSPRLVIGTHPSAELVLTDPTVSRFHCEIVIEAGRATVHDLGSKNRTLVDGVAVNVAPLSDGATLTIGKTTVRARRDAGGVRLELSASARFGGLVGRSAAMRAVFARLERAAPNDATVLLVGETGTGKDTAALALHDAGPRRGGPFVVIDLAAIPHALLASELFGHDRGAFTGADQDRVGAFERARGGTVFLDEIGDLDPALQPQLLRVLEHRTVQRLGSSQRIPVDVRVIAATHRDLRADVNDRAFRSDLYYRIAVLDVVLPPLRDRIDDVPLLIEEIVRELEPEPDARARVLDPVWQARLMRLPWPGNVRELRNHVERAIGLDDRDAPAGRGSDVDVDVPLKAARARWVQLFESRYLGRLLEIHAGNVSAAARAAGVDRVHFYRLLERAGLKGRGT